MSTKDETNAAAVDACNKRVAGIQKHVTDPNIVIPISGKLCKPADVAAIFQRDLDARARVDSLKAQLASAMEERDRAASARRAADVAFRSWVVNLFGATAKETLEIGYPAPKPRTTSVATKAVAIQKSAATRAARHTMGPKQRLEITGTTPVFSSPEAAAAAAAKRAELVLPQAPHAHTVAAQPDPAMRV